MNRAFTLTELLVSITIVFVLLGLALYVVSRVQDSSRTTLCATNLMQLSHALSLYVSDYDSTYPVAFRGAIKDSGDGIRRGTGSSWYRCVFPYVIGPDQKNPICCPSVNSAEILSSIGNEWEGPSGSSCAYAYNGSLSQWNDDATKKVPNQSEGHFDAKTENEVDHSSLVAVFAEARIGIIAINKPDTDMHAVSYAPLQDIIKKQPLGAIRHDGGANYAFIDGHIKWFKPEQLNTDEKCDGKTPGFGL